MRIIKVPQNTIPVRYDDQQPPVIKVQNFFWFTLMTVLRNAFARMSGIDLLSVADVYKEITEQDGQPELRIARDGDWEKLKGWVENHKGWPGNPEDVVAMLLAVREAEKTKAESKPKTKES